MATTVKYKGSTLTTVDNATKVLETAGTWLEDDLTLVDVSGGGSGNVTLLKTVNITSAVNTATVTITASEMQAYRYFIAVYDLSGDKDYMYFNFDSLTKVDRPYHYDDSVTRHIGTLPIFQSNAYENNPALQVFGYPSRNSYDLDSSTLDTTVDHYIAFIMYSASKNITSGKIELYGVTV